MKKLLTIALAAVMVLAFTLPVLAETAVKFKGSYRVRYWYKNNLNLAHKQKQENKETYFDHRFRLAFSFLPSEFMSVNVSAQALKDQKWGNQKSKMDWNNKSDAKTLTVTPLAGGGSYMKSTSKDVNSIWDNGVEFYRVYMTINTPYGKFDVGRMSGGEAGLTIFGYYGSSFHDDWSPFNTEGPRDRIKYTFTSGNFTLVGYFEKLEEIDSNTGDYDSDIDSYNIVPVFTFGSEGFKGAVNCLFTYTRDRSGLLNIGSNFSNAPLAAGAAYNTAGLYAVADSATGTVTGVMGMNGGMTDLYSIWPAAQIEFGPLALRTTFKYVTGTYTPSEAAGSSYSKIQLSGFGFYADTTYTYGGGMAGLSYLYVQGDETEKNKQFNPTSTLTQGRTKKMTNMVGAGGDYCPLLVAYDVDLDTTGLNDQPNHWSLVAWWDHSLTEELMVEAAYGYIYVNNTPRNVKHDYGHEVDAGVKASIYENAELSSRFGYFIAGKYHRGAKVAGNYANKINNGWVWKNELIVNF
ncbi:MAG: hypothetical protein V1816_09915 [Pseudomonadota bacterium]